MLPLQPSRGVDERPILLSEARAGQAINGRVDLLYLFGWDAGRAPELARLVRIEFADDQPVSLFERLDVLPRIRSDHYAVHAEGEDPLDVALIHVIPDFDPRILTINLRQVMERPIVFFL